MTMRLKDKVILITGATSGIGAAMARLFVSEGAKIALHGKNEAEARECARRLARGCDVPCVVGIGGDLSDPATPPAIVASARDAFGRIDGLVNNAALTTRGDLCDTSAALFDQIIAVNLRAPLLLIRAALPHFRRQGGGRVVNIGSINSYCGEKNLLPYSISKGGLMTLTRNLADAHAAEGIRVNQLNVGWTLTENEQILKRRDGLPDDWASHLPKTFAPSGRLLSPDDVAYAALYLLSDEAALVNGTIMDLEQYPVIGRNPQKEV